MRAFAKALRLVPSLHAPTLSLYPSSATFAQRPPSALVSFILQLLESLHVVVLTRDAKSGKISDTTNLTLINAVLVFRGVRPPPARPLRASSGAESDIAAAESSNSTSTTPEMPAVLVPSGPRITEYGLWVHIMALQVTGSILAFGVRYWLSGLVFPQR